MNQSSHNENHDLRVAFIAARWHGDIVDRCRSGFIDAMARASNGRARIDEFEVPGAFEIPLLARSLARGGGYDAVVASAFVVNGGIYRHDFVSETVVAGLMQAQMETDVPVFSAVLTPHNYHDSPEQRAFFRDHFVLKGQEAADACLSILDLRRRLSDAA